MKISRYFVTKIICIIILMLVIPLCFSAGCVKDNTQTRNNGGRTGKPSLPWTPSARCAYRFEKTQYSLDEEVGITLFYASNVSKERFENSKEGEFDKTKTGADMYVLSAETSFAEQGIKSFKNRDEFEQYEQKVHIEEIPEFFSDNYPFSDKSAEYSNIKRVVIPQELLVGSSGQIRITISLQYVWSLGGVVFNYKVDDSSLELTEMLFGEEEAEFSEELPFMPGERVKGALDILCVQDKTKFKEDEKVVLNLMYQTKMTEEYIADQVEAWNEYYAKQGGYKPRVRALVKKGCFNVGYPTTNTHEYINSIWPLADSRVVLKEFDSFTAEEYPYELKEGYQVDNVVIPKALLTGETGEIGLVLEAHYRAITSIYYKKVGDTVLLSQTRFYD